MRRTCGLVLGAGVLPAEAALTLDGEVGLDLGPQLLVDQRVVAAVASSPRGHPLPAERAAQRGLIHRLQEAHLERTARASHLVRTDPPDCRCVRCVCVTLQKVCVQGSVTGSTKISRHTGQLQSSRDRAPPLLRPPLSDTSILFF